MISSIDRITPPAGGSAKSSRENVLSPEASWFLDPLHPVDAMSKPAMRVILSTGVF